VEIYCGEYFFKITHVFRMLVSKPCDIFSKQSLSVTFTFGIAILPYLLRDQVGWSIFGLLWAGHIAFRILVGTEKYF